MDQTSLSPLWQSPTRRDGFSLGAKPALPSGGVYLCSRMPRRPMWVVDYPVPRDVPLDRASVWPLLPSTSQRAAQGHSIYDGQLGVPHSQRCQKMLDRAQRLKPSPALQFWTQYRERQRNTFQQRDHRHQALSLSNEPHCLRRGLP